MTRTLLRQAIITVWSCAAAYAAENEAYLCSTWGKGDQVAYKYAISTETLGALKESDPAAGTLAVSASEAIRLALADYRALYNLGDQVEFTGLTLTPIQGTYRKWQYWINFHAKDGALPDDSVAMLIVLSDGTVVRPTVDPNPVAFPTGWRGKKK